MRPPPRELVEEGRTDDTDAARGGTGGFQRLQTIVMSINHAISVQKRGLRFAIWGKHFALTLEIVKELNALRLRDFLRAAPQRKSSNRLWIRPHAHAASHALGRLVHSPVKRYGAARVGHVCKRADILIRGVEPRPRNCDKVPSPSCGRSLCRRQAVVRFPACWIWRGRRDDDGAGGKERREGKRYISQPNQQFAALACRN